MNTARTFRTSTTAAAHTEQLAEKIGGRLRGGEVIVLSSDLGGGKTAFVRGLARGMGSQDHVSSPTFTISRQYSSSAPPADGRLSLTLYHFDFYRLPEPGLVARELAEVLNDPAAVVAVEWGNVVENVLNQALPPARLMVSIAQTAASSRDFTFTYPTELAYLFETFAVKV